jgi:hypothetical protein
MKPRRHLSHWRQLASAVVLALALAAAAALPSGAQAATQTGWGTTTTAYIGRYQVSPGSKAPAPPATRDGIFTVALNAASRLAAASQQPTGGQLSVFLRKVKTGLPLSPSGILSLRTQEGNLIIYLTDLTSAGTTRSGMVNQGAFLGTPIGTLTATPDPSAGGTLDATIKASGLPEMTLKLKRFSISPTP